ncbi:hypothetical protein PR048_024184 [Dryococelus australis]|uniref:Uncharacterized protein n=1 Tax=Dryococelus australis TaxID=614101 RepID=A0ABQ9GW67_9NEOP|nr:hypothetical protein PR048_024184 [Dryococelus australis]
MLEMFLNTYHVNVLYKVYWSILTQKFNIKFGFPRSDTCSICDTLATKINNPECSTEEREKLETEKKSLATKSRRIQKKKKDISLHVEFAIASFENKCSFCSRQLCHNVFGDVHD